MTGDRDENDDKDGRRTTDPFERLLPPCESCGRVRADAVVVGAGSDKRRLCDECWVEERR